MNNLHTGRRPQLRSRAAAARALLSRNLEPFETLEPRRLFSGADPYAYRSPLDALAFDQFVETIRAPLEAADTRFGTVVEALGDIDGDGHIDFAVSAPGSQDAEGRWVGDPGSVFIYSGQSKALIRTITGEVAGFGSALRSLGDVNADGVADLAIGSPSTDRNADATLDFTGSVTVYSGADGAVVWTRDGASRLDELGWAIALARDVNADGVNDVFVGAPGAGGDLSTAGPGAAFVLSGVDGAIIRTFTGEANGDRFGHAVDAGFDAPLTMNVNVGDGQLDYLVGAPGNSAGGAGAGRAYAFNGSDGSVRHTFTGEAGDELGSAAAMVGIGTINQGFLFRYAIGRPGNDDNAGGVQLWTADGNDTQLDSLPSPEAGSRFGEHIYRLDFAPDQEGAQVFVVSAPLSTSGNQSSMYPGNTTNNFNLAQRRISTASWITAVGNIDTDDYEIDFVAGFAGNGTVLSIPLTLAWAPASISIRATSDNGLYMALSSGTNPIAIEAPRYIVRDGQLLPVAGISNFPVNGRILGVNDAGLYFGATSAANSTSTPLDQFFFYYRGEVTNLLDAVTQVVGRLPIGASLIRVGENGDILLLGPVDPDDGEITTSSFLFRGGVLTELPLFDVADVNRRGEIVGTDFSVDSFNGRGLVLRADGTRVELPTGFYPERIDDAGVMYGVSIDAVTETRQLAVYRNGVVTVLSSEIVGPPTSFAIGWTVLDVDNDGRILGRFEYTFNTPRPPSSTVSTLYLYSPEEGLRRLTEIIAGEPENTDQMLTLTGLLGSGDLVVGGQFAQVNRPGVSGQGDAPTSAGVGAGVTVTFINSDGDAVVFQRDALGYRGQVLAWDVAFGEIDDVDTYTDRRDGMEYAIVHTTSDRVIWFRRGGDGVFGEGRLLAPGEAGSTAESIVGQIATFFSVDGRLHITGVSADGDVLIYYQNGAAAPDALENWTGENLSENHVGFQGFTIPDFSADTELVPYVTSWGGMNIAGLNAAGEIEVVWWAPGMPLWRSDNLTEESGGPALTGRLVSFVAPWGAMHLAAVTASGDLISTWWSAESNVWAASNLTTEFDGASLEADSLTAYTTDWGGLNIAGIDTDTGLTTVYWWTPDTGGWISEALHLDRPFTLVSGRLESQVIGSSLNIFAHDSEGRQLRIFWFPSQGGDWRVEFVESGIG
ncbi:MAG: FG-GAP repeat protein [Pyrinomonadaceae bacterium]|nr:FG-GAP repeat protein [Phycisphaerales bacterium]